MTSITRAELAQILDCPVELYALWRNNPDEPEFWRRVRKQLESFLHDDDLIQIALIKVFQALPSYEPRKPFTNWLSRIAKNTLIDSSRSNKHELTFIEDVEIPSANAIMPDWSSIPDEFKPVCKYLLDGYSLKEIAEKMGMPEGTLRWKLMRLRQRNKQTRSLM
jgi:RNA polymerase sigma factor (sigma-70 family)